MVEVAHADHFVTRYAHLDKRHVEVGQNVQRGQSLGLLGNSGRSTGPHLHYEVLYKNRHTNPEAPLLALWQDRR
jgi:murein DD-endopeptidase MepM/ murein hydrolase activator NlpD